ncbi:hypothetical protein ANN_04767 [Periplaneta americana]|uniref:Mos1 transposase HTH domain-containing protein n=1 Tax=Periplaneta americana TaxID=6978 RepID=A0ABQ8TBE0_PERAM|nr:hypothetical protein ANN_04767 [Periplaneta americana]
MNPGSSTESCPAFAHIGLRENPGKNINQVTCPDRESNPGHLVSRPDALIVTSQVWTRDILLFEFNREEKATETARKICAAYGENAIGERTATEWFSRYNTQQPVQNRAGYTDKRIHSMREMKLIFIPFPILNDNNGDIQKTGDKDFNSLYSPMTKNESCLWRVFSYLINVKTYQMTFRKGGRTSATDTLTLNDSPLTTVNNLKYLGVTLQSTANSFSYHIQERIAAATRAIHQINDLTRLSLETAMVLLKTVITPIVTYGITLIWEKLTLTDLERIEKVKARFLKCTLGIGQNAPSRLVYEMTRETFYVEDIRLQILLQSTQPYKDLLERREDKRRTIDPDFYATGAMVDRNWTKENQTQRHAITRFAIRGFHHKFYHEQFCVCELCDVNDTI